MPTSKAEYHFIDQYTRRLLIKWADYSLTCGLPPANQTGARMVDSVTPHPTLGLLRVSSIYVKHAQAMGWLSEEEPLHVLPEGYEVAARLLENSP